MNKIGDAIAKITAAGMSLAALVWLTTIVVCVVGCNTDPQPPPPLVNNSQKNRITDQQKLVRHFHTAEVFAMPDNDSEFLVRDTNGAVWYVRSARAGDAQQGQMVIFGPKVPPPVVLPEEPETEDEIKQRQALAALQATAQVAADTAKSMLTNNAAPK